MAAIGDDNQAVDTVIVQSTSLDGTEELARFVQNHDDLSIDLSGGEP